MVQDTLNDMFSSKGLQVMGEGAVACLERRCQVAL